MKKIKSLAMLLLGLCIAFTSCEKQPEPEPEPTPVPVTGITLDSSSLTLTEGETARLTATISPSNADNQGVIWSSSDASVASVSNGTVTAVAAGSATITAKSDDGGKTATCEITVKERIYPVESVSLDKTNLELTEGDEATLIATIMPDNASNKQVFWKSEDETIAIVSDGKVKAIKPGSTTITVTTSDGNKTASCSVKVNERIYHVESVSLDKASLELSKGEEYTLVATVLPENATDKSVSWISDNDEVATVNNGKIAAMAPGEATITVRTVDGEKTATCNVTVKNAVPEAVDLGLSVKWASFNIGASAPEEYGDYYAWGETETKSKYFKFETYKFYKSEKEEDYTDDDGYVHPGEIISGYTKYVQFGGWGFNGFYDNKTTLDMEDDVAHVKLGGKWRMPTEAEYEELIANCKFEFVTYKGTKGMKLTSMKPGYTGNYIFLPAAGYCSGSGLGNVSLEGHYWSSSISYNENYPKKLFFNQYNSSMGWPIYRCNGLPVRPVCE